MISDENGANVYFYFPEVPKNVLGRGLKVGR